MTPTIGQVYSGKVKAVDLFCGAGGMSSGLINACDVLGLRCDLTAINHWPIAVKTHTVNHPNAKHLCEDISNVNPRKMFKEGEVNILIGGPSCVSHSAARGGRPLDCDQDRATPWCMVRWAESTLPEIILIENVPQFVRWGPLVRRRCKAKVKVPTMTYKAWRANQKKKNLPFQRELWKKKVKWTQKEVLKLQWVPDKKREGETFQAWKKCLEALGYKVSHRVFCAADYGDPTTRKRLFVLAVRGKRKIVWANPTHHEAPAEAEHDLFSRQLRPWVPARRIINFNIEGRSIFNRPDPLVEKTLRRVWIGFKKFALPKIIEAKLAERGLSPEGYLVPNFGERGEQEPRAHELGKPVPAVTSHGAGRLVTPELKKAKGDFIVRFKGTATAESTDKPVTALQASGKHHALTEVNLKEDFIVRYHGNSDAESADKPISTIEAGAQKHYLATTELSKKKKGKKGEGAFITELAYGDKVPGDSKFRVKPLEKTIGTITGANNWAIAEGELNLVDPPSLVLPQNGGGQIRPDTEPAPTVLTGGAIRVITSNVKPVGEDFLVQVAHGNDRESDNNRRVKSKNQPMPSLTGSPEWAVGEANIKKPESESYLLHTNHGDGDGKGQGRVHSLDKTPPTICGNRGELALATAEIGGEPFMAAIDHKGPKGSDPKGQLWETTKPVSTITSKARHVLIESKLTPKGKNYEETAFLIKYFRTGIAKTLNTPLDTVTGKDRFGLVTTELVPFDPDAEGLPTKGKVYVEILGELYELEMKLRMLEPEELALAQGFDKSYEFLGNKTQVVKQIGNAVPRRLVRALIIAAYSQNPDVPFPDEPEEDMPNEQQKKSEPLAA